MQKRCFTDIEDGIDALMAILKNEGNVADGQIFNIGNPKNNHSIRELAETLQRILATFPGYSEKARNALILDTPSETYYGEGYEDVEFRVPSIEKARRLLGWEPRIPLEETLRKTLSAAIGQERPS